MDVLRTSFTGLIVIEESHATKLEPTAGEMPGLAPQYVMLSPWPLHDTQSRNHTRRKGLFAV
jgi:hypothetical protein